MALTMVVAMTLNGQPPTLDGVADENSALIRAGSVGKGFQHCLYSSVKTRKLNKILMSQYKCIIIINKIHKTVNKTYFHAMSSQI
jgi:hypothetical protein